MTPRKTAQPGKTPQTRKSPARTELKLPDWQAPQLASVTSSAPRGEDWIHEIKFDGYRVLAWLDRDGVRLFTRNRKDWTDRFPAVAEVLAGLDRPGTVLDGEVSVELADGRTSFQALQNAGSGGGVLRFHVFDVLYLDGKSVLDRPQLERKALVRDLVHGLPEPVRYSDHVVGSGPAFHAQACRHGLEGIISKRASAPYRGGRGRDWLKVKCLSEQEFVVGGHTAPSGSRKGLGALHVGVFDPEGVFRYRGKVGTGFNASSLKQLRGRLDPLQRKTSPFDDGPTGAAARGSRWVEPQLVVQVSFAEITQDGRLRHPVYRGIREDKDARDVRDEIAPASSTGATAGTAKSAVASSKRSAASARSAAASRGKSAAPGSNAAGTGTADPSAAASASSAPKPRRPGQPLTIAGVRVSSPDKILYADVGLTKLDLVRYYEAIAGWMLPHLSDRPLTLLRCPDGPGDSCFYQKHFSAKSLPEPLGSVRVREKKGYRLYGVLDSVEGLLALVQLNALEFHTWNSRKDRLDRPDRFVIDLDPDPGVAWDAVVDAALHVRDALLELGLRSFLKTTGGKGLHVVVPLTRRTDWDDVHAFSRAVASLLSQAAPELYTTEMSKAKRKGRILLDYQRNGRGATAVEAYSTRARAGATVAAPIHWDELADGVRADSFTVRNMPDRVAELGADPWNEMAAVKQSITAAMQKRLGL
jgi:bifunctional non-homologous end joining protein LigD